MASTKLVDIIEPKVFAPYVREAIIEKSAIIRSGIVVQSPRLNDLVAGGGRTMNMPRFKRISGRSQILSDTNPLETKKIGTDEDVATMHLRGDAWSANELASAVAGASAMGAIASQVADYWVEDEQATLIATLNGTFASASMANHVFGEGTKAIDAKMTLNAKQLLGDAANQLKAVLMHSATYTSLQIQDLIEYVVPSEGGKPIPYYLGYSVIVDDTMPVDTDIYTTYLMASSVIARGDGTPVDLTPVELDRDSLASEDILIHRRAFALHPIGVAWTGNAASTTPSNVELETGTNWNRVYNDKHIGMVAIKHKLNL